MRTLDRLVVLPPPAEVTTMAPGDLCFCHGKGIVDWAIRAAEWLRFRKGAKYNHVGMLVEYLGNGDWSVIEAESPGIIMTTLSSLRAHGEVEIVPLPYPCQSDRAVNFMKYQIGEQYGFLTIASLIVSLILPGSLSLYKPGTWICSAVIAEALRYGGWYCQWTNVYQVTPAQLYIAVTGRDNKK
jgi:hypothetical protein